MDITGWAWILIILANVLVSLRGFRNQAFFNAWTFEVDRVLKQREWHRLLTSGFLHVSGSHLAFNMITLYFFAGSIEAYLGSISFMVIYFGSLIGGNLFSLFVHRHNDLYRAVGASGAVSGVVFAAIALFPGMELAFIFVPIPFPGWIYGVGFVLYSIYGIRSQRDNIGHEAHLGGAILGVVLALLYRPGLLQSNTLAIALILVPTLIFVLLIIYRPQILMIDKKYDRYKSTDDRYHERRQIEEQELNRILEKIQKDGRDSLTAEEMKLLNKYR
ncbi:MAG: rhomboid family intramembrane serine protease [Owenweeksia sp.]|nr:rhomboid family intramembrane serine protease [Owenweeksia sp.]